MYPTWGYVLIKNYLKKFHSFPSREGCRGFGTLILVTVNFLFTIYPFTLKLYDVNTYNQTILYQIQFHIIEFASCCISLLGITSKKKLLNIIDNFSNFNSFGVPKKITSIENKMKIVLKNSFFIVFTAVLLLLYETLQDKSCFNITSALNNTPCYVVMEYYLPFPIDHWGLATITTFQTFYMTITACNCIGGLLFFSYTIELLVIRLEHLSQKIDESRFEIGQTNFDELKDFIEYYKDIVSKFTEVNKLMNKTVMILKLCVLTCIALSCVRIATGHVLSGLSLLSTTVSILFLKHAVGQRLITASSRVTDSIYNLNWYDADVMVQKNVLTFLCASQRTLTLNISLFGGTSHSNLAGESKKIYIWYNWITKIMRKRNYM